MSAPLKSYYKSTKELSFKNNLVLLRLSDCLVIDLDCGKSQYLRKHPEITHWEKVSGFFTHHDTESQKEYWFFYLEGQVYTYLPLEETWDESVQRLDLGSWSNHQFIKISSDYILSTTPYQVFMVGSDGQIIGIHTLYPKAHFSHYTFSGNYFYGLRETNLCLYDFTGVRGNSEPILRNRLELKDCNDFATIGSKVFLWTKGGELCEVSQILNRWDRHYISWLPGCNLRKGILSKHGSLWFIRACETTGVIHRWNPQDESQQRVSYIPHKLWVGDSYFVVKRLEATSHGTQYYLYSTNE
jgi:hypothetical protein